MPARKTRERSDPRGISPKSSGRSASLGKPGANGRLAALLAVTTFCSAFLLFQVQPLICKAILPWFGGTPAVWTTSMFFFQIVLLLGYCYAHWTTQFLSTKWQMWIHAGLVMAAILLLPIRPSEVWKPTGSEANPAWRLLGLLTRTVGVQFLLLSTTAPLVQVWWHRLFGGAPYRLYAISNAGSLLALMSYPFLVEPMIGVSTQVLAWSAAFFLVACSLAGGSYRHAQIGSEAKQHAESESVASRPSRLRIASWLALSTTGSVLLLAMTNHITQNVAVVPFLWVAPLALYLLSFILSFGNATYYRRWFFGGMMLVTQTASAFLYNFDVVESITVLLIIHLSALFFGCMVCHGELARMKPPARFLTNYFVVISIGGALGGFLVSIVAPYVFTDYYEYPLVLATCWCLLIVITLRDKTSYLYGGRPIWAWGLVAACCFLFLTCLRNAVINDALSSYLSRRSFYGILSVRPHLDDEGGKQVQLVHGMISHGTQYLDEERQYEPTSYYRRQSGLGLAMESVQGKRDKRIGMLGLGVGTIAAYSEVGDYFRVYEINQQVIDIATDPEIFTFWSLLKQRGARGEIILGDARFSLEKELRDGRGQNFDVLVLDVFSGDAIPVHLLTIQAFKIYFRHLAENGMLAVHISNRHLDLLPIVWSSAEQFDAQVAFVSSELSEWVILASAQAISRLEENHPTQVQLLGQVREPQIWTDDYSDILSVLK